MRRVCIGEGLLVKSKRQEGTEVPCLLKQRAICNLLKSHTTPAVPDPGSQPLSMEAFGGHFQTTALGNIIFEGKKETLLDK